MGGGRDMLSAVRSSRAAEASLCAASRERSGDSMIISMGTEDVAAVASGFKDGLSAGASGSCVFKKN